jgi:hypothetical protein
MVHQCSNIHPHRRRHALNCGLINQVHEPSIVPHMYLKALLFGPCLGTQMIRGALLPHADKPGMLKIE